LLIEFHVWKIKVIAEVNGLATAAGCQLVATCDFVVASTNASFATPGVKTGLFWYHINSFFPQFLLFFFFTSDYYDVLLKYILVCVFLKVQLLELLLLGKSLLFVKHSKCFFLDNPLGMCISFLSKNNDIYLTLCENIRD
jgi:hypothetical protein